MDVIRLVLIRETSCLYAIRSPTYLSEWKNFQGKKLPFSLLLPFSVIANSLWKESAPLGANSSRVCPIYEEFFHPSKWTVSHQRSLKNGKKRCYGYRILPAIRRGFRPSRMTSNNLISPMKFCYNTNSTLPKQCQSSRSVLQDGSRTFGLFWKEKKKPSYNLRNTVVWLTTLKSQ